MKVLYFGFTSIVIGIVLLRIWGKFEILGLGNCLSILRDYYEHLGLFVQILIGIFHLYSIDRSFFYISRLCNIGIRFSFICVYDALLDFCVGLLYISINSLV